MSSVFDAFESAPSSNPALREGWIRTDPTPYLFFTTDSESVALHWERDPQVKCYLQCLGLECPYCKMGTTAQDFVLLPVYDLEDRVVKVVKISLAQGPEALATKLLPMLKTQDLASTAFLISQSNRQYRVDTRKLGENADRGLLEIKAFQSQYESGLRLTDAFRKMTADEIRGIERLQWRFQDEGDSGDEAGVL